MSWRTASAGFVGVLLALPLVVLLGGLLGPWVRDTAVSGGAVSPMLDTEQRTRLATYRRSCGTSAECDPPLGCLYESRYKQAYCADSQCSKDEQCPEGQRCRGLATLGKGPQVRICVPVGVRQEGESCDESPGDKRRACVDGLLCGGDNFSWCAHPCHLGDAVSGCSEGFFCADTSPQPLCLPTCEKNGCSEGQQCVRFEQGVSVCARVYGADCQRSPCSENRVCSLRVAPTHPGKVWMECVEHCGEGFPACSAGKVCDAWHCLRACNPQDPNTCDEGYQCSQIGQDSPMACRPDYLNEEAL